MLIKGGEALETAYKLQTLVLDKTGTITRGEPALTDLVPLSGIDEGELLRLAASAERGSEHSLGEALVRAAEDRGIRLADRADSTPSPDMASRSTLTASRSCSATLS